jgi:RNA polymerase sigma-70 factor (ECF subfamily)
MTGTTAPRSVATSESDPLVDAARRGERHALRTLVSRLLPRVRNLVRYLVRGDLEVDDLAQDALIEIVRSLPGYRGDGSFDGWVGRIVTRSTLATVRRRRMERAQSYQEEGSSADLRIVGADDRNDDYLERRRLVQVLDRIPDEQRLALVLHHVVEMSVPEIAEALGAPLETIRSRLRLGRARVRSLLSPGDGAEGEEP